MKTQAVVVAEDPVYLNWLQNAAPGAEFTLVRPLDAEDLIERVQMLGRPDMVFFQVDAASVSTRAAMIETLLDRMPDLPAAAVGADNSPEIVLAAMRAGARDFFVLRKDEANVAASLGRLLRRTAQAAQSARGGVKGKIFAVLSAHAYEGTAFLAEHLAHACAQALRGESRTERVLLLDIATPAGAAAIFLNVAQSYSVLDAVNDVYRCDQTLVDTAFPKHASGLYLLSLPEDSIGRPALNHEEFGKLLQILRGLFSVIVVAADAQQLPLAGVKDIIAQADRTLLLSDQSILKSRHSKYLLRALRLDDCALDRMQLVVDQYRKRLGLEPQNLAELLDLPLLAALGADTVTRQQAMNSGEPLYTLAPKDVYCADVSRLAQALLGGQNRVEDAPKGVLSRLFE